jgi:hypothetical protein
LNIQTKFLMENIKAYVQEHKDALSTS